MPKISEFKKSKKQGKIAGDTVIESKTQIPTPTSKVDGKAEERAEKRRPGRNENSNDKVAKTKISVVEVEPMTDMNMSSENNNSGDHSEADSHAAASAASSSASAVNKIEINFPGSEVLRAKFPKSFEAAESVVTDWVNDGKFDEIPEMGHPLAKAALQHGLLKAKEIEKKVMSSPVTEKVTMQAFSYAMKAQNLVNQLKTKVNQKNEK